MQLFDQIFKILYQFWMMKLNHSAVIVRNDSLGSFHAFQARNIERAGAIGGIVIGK